jgi:hypothetical protein
MTTASNSSWWTLAQCAVSFPIVRMRGQPAHSSLAPTADQSQCGVPSAAAFRSGCARFFVTFFLAAVYRPILGLDFLSAHGLLVDPVSRHVLDSKTLKPLSKTPAAAGTLRSKFAAALCSITPSVRSLLASYPAIVGDGKGKPSPKHKIRHTIETTGRRANVPLPLPPPMNGQRRGLRLRIGPSWLPSPMRSRSTFRRWPPPNSPARRWRR